MTDANQVRINELARELEVKAKAIIDLLPGVGVTEKKTHSNSIAVGVTEKARRATIPVYVAENVRGTIQGQAEADAAAESAAAAERQAKEAAARAARQRPAAPTAPRVTAPASTPH